MAQQQTERVSDVGVVGSAAQVEDGLAELEASGVTDLNPIMLHVEEDPESARRTRELLASLARRGRS